MVGAHGSDGSKGGGSSKGGGKKGKKGKCGKKDGGSVIGQVHPSRGMSRTSEDAKMLEWSALIGVPPTPAEVERHSEPVPPEASKLVQELVPRGVPADDNVDMMSDASD